jgi:sigma-B regulation protein RsbU (phosphoserine phosphatase)
LNEQLDLLAEMARDFAATRDIEGAMARALARIAALVGAEGGALFVLDETAENLVCSASYGPVDIKGLSVGAGQGIVGRSVEGDVSEMVRDVAADPHFKGALDEKTGFVTKSILCAPMTVQGERIGAIELVNKTSRSEVDGESGLFADEDLKFLEALAASAGLAILNARMAGELAEQEVMRRELVLAAEIQRGLLPPPGAADFPVAGVNRPARVVSGDFYDFFTLYDGRIAFTLADVSGKGMNAALLMAKAASLFRCLGKEDLRPGRLLQRINAEVCETSLRGMFVTMVGGTYDPATGRVVLSNAGHEPPLLHDRDGSFTALSAGAPPVGIPPELTGGGPVPEDVLFLNGGSLYIFTDGVTEGYVAAGEELGDGGFKKMIEQGLADGQDATARIVHVADRLTASGQTLRDDVTILVIDDSGPALTRTAQPLAEQFGAQGHAGQDHADQDLADGLLCQLNLPGRAQSLIMVRRAVEAAASTCGFPKEQTQDIVLAVDEACQNVVRHAYGGRGGGDMVVDLRREKGEFQILIRDFAPAVDVERIKPRNLDDVRPGGLGVHFIREVMDHVDYLPPPDGQGNLLRLKKTINA